MVTQIVSVRFGNNTEFRVNWRVRSTPIALRWAESLKNALPYGIFENDRIYNMPNQLWNRETICSKIIECMEKIELFHPGFFEAWPTPNMNHDVTNIMHVAFERLRGSVDNPSEIFLNAPAELRAEIAKYNILIHRWESFVMNGPPRVVCTFNNQFKTPLIDEDYQYFSLSHPYGAMLINYAQVGKQVMDVYRDNDDVVTPEAIRPMDRYGANFVVRFVEVDNAASNKIMMSFNEWYYRNHNYMMSAGLDIQNPKLAIGYIQVADLIEEHGRAEMLEQIGSLNTVRDVQVIEE